MLGSSSRYAYDVVLEGRKWDKVNKYYEAKAGHKLELPKLEKSDRIHVRLSKKDIQDVREMLKLRIQSIMEAITLNEAK